MENHYLQELIDETIQRGGGLILNYNNKPAVVVLTVEKYNQLISGQVSESQNMSGTENSETENNLFFNPPKPKRKILVTGGAGYIGAHICRVLLKQGYDIVVLDNLSTGKRQNVPEEAIFIEGDLKDENLLKDIFAAHKFYAVIHLAASVEVEESIKFPGKYLENNSINTAKLLSFMEEAGVDKIIFSSTAAVYGQPDNLPITENTPLKPESPYGSSKLLAEKIIKYQSKYSNLRAIVFRYFNACGCDFDGNIKPTHESHLIPLVMEVASGKKTVLTVYGSDYQTPDGSCVRDFVHVLDIARAHVLALEKIEFLSNNFEIYNIGTGRGNSVLDIIQNAAEVLNKMIPLEKGPRRPGDPAILVADNNKIKKELGFELQYSDLPTILKTSWLQVIEK